MNVSVLKYSLLFYFKNLPRRVKIIFLSIKKCKALSQRHLSVRRVFVVNILNLKELSSKTQLKRNLVPKKESKIVLFKRNA